jgi:hypothetical protein
MFVDEVGKSDLGSSDDINHRYLSVSGVIISSEQYRQVIDPEVRALKLQIFQDDKIVLHRREILNKKPPFHCLQDQVQNERFGNLLLDGLRDWDYKLITVAIDKQAHRDRYKVWRFHPYHYCMTLLLERYVWFLCKRNSTGDVLAESRNRFDDEKLKLTTGPQRQRPSPV